MFRCCVERPAIWSTLPRHVVIYDPQRLRCRRPALEAPAEDDEHPKSLQCRR